MRGSAEMPEPPGPAHLDRTHYRSAPFFGQTLDVPLKAAADYIQQLSRAAGHEPHVVCLHDEFSWEDADSGLAWRVTLVLGEMPPRP